MTKKLSFLGIGLAIFITVIMSGCSQHFATITYHNPTWHPNGKILAARSVYEYDTLLNYPGTVKNEQGAVYLAEIEIDSNNNYIGERDLFELESGSYEIKISASPDGNYIMYHAFEGVNNPSVIRIVSYPTGEKVNDIYWNENINSLDWGPDSDRIVFATADTKKMFIMKKDGTGTFEVTGSAEAVAWRVGEKIAYELLEGGYYYLGRINSDGLSIENYGAQSVYDPQISAYNSNYIYGIAASAFRKIDVSIVPPIEEVLISSLSFIQPRLSFNNTKLVGGNWTQSGIVDIWVVDINGDNEKQIK